MKRLLFVFTLIVVSVLSASAQNDYYIKKAQSYQREAEFYQKKADGYRREAAYYLKKAEGYQREGRQGQSYAIPTIGGVIGLKEIRQSVKTFTEYAHEHPELHFLVTPIGCGGGCRRPSEIAPMFRDAAKLPNVSLPEEFWDILNR